MIIFNNSKRILTMIKLTTSFGNITIELDHENAPNTSKNFEKYVKDGFYDGKIFHRVIDNFMIQGGGFDSEMNESKTYEPIENEADNGLQNKNGTIAMARTNDPHSATAQFFINVNDNDFLNHTGKTPQGWGYAVFGKVVDGMDIISKIKETRTGTKGFHQDVPIEPIIIEKVVIEN
jgi:peptidyl-prolyl cis-trans isomerase B (cyclophilin B)